MIKNFDVNVIILDDAFQHRKINRSIDIALLNINTPIKSLKLFPLGILREHFKNVYRADILLITKQNPLSKTKNIQFANNLYFHNKFFVSNSFRLFNPLSNIEIEKNALLMANYLLNNKKVSEVFHPALPHTINHNSNEVIEQYFFNYLVIETI